MGKYTNLEKADTTIYTRVMAAVFFLRFGVKIGSAAITRRKRGIFFSQIFSMVLAFIELQYSLVLALAILGYCCSASTAG